jgi:hypothetical protein
MKLVFQAFAVLLAGLDGWAAWNLNFVLTMQLGALLLLASFGVLLAELVAIRTGETKRLHRKIRSWEERNELFMAELGASHDKMEDASARMDSAAATLDGARFELERLLAQIQEANAYIRPGWDGPSSAIVAPSLKAVPHNGR